jgi:hypothetical protein
MSKCKWISWRVTHAKAQFIPNRTFKLVSRWDNCNSVIGAYVEKWWYFCTINQLYLNLWWLLTVYDLWNLTYSTFFGQVTSVTFCKMPVFNSENIVASYTNISPCRLSASAYSHIQYVCSHVPPLFKTWNEPCHGNKGHLHQGISRLADQPLDPQELYCM